MIGKTKQLKAAERALGLDPIGAETDEEARLRQAWEMRLAPLGLAVPESLPPDDMWVRILRSLDRANTAKVIKRARRGRAFWRTIGIGATALAAGLAYLVLNPAARMADPATEAPAAQYVAVVTPEGAKAALIVEVDLEAGTAVVRPVGINVEEGKSLELWRIAPESDPASVGVIASDATQRIDVAASPGDTFAISLEPEGGSPTGAPTGPVLYSGELIAVPE